MGTAETKDKIHNAIKHIPVEKLDIVLSFLEDLQQSSEDETAILISDSGFMNDYKKAKEDIRTGKTISFKAIYRDV